MPFDVLDRLLRPLRSKALPRRYPDAPPEMPAPARGRPELDPRRCDASAACVNACPTGAILVDGATWRLDLGACIFCGACARACPRGAIRHGHQVELATMDRADLVIERAPGAAR